MLWKHSVVQDMSKKASVSPVFQKGKKKCPDNYEPYHNSWESDGQLVLETILRHRKDKMVIRNNQHGITMGKLCIMNLIVSAMRCLAWWMRGHSWKLFNSALVRLLTLSPITSSLTRWQSTCQIIEQESALRSSWMTGPRGLKEEKAEEGSYQ